MGVFLNSLRRTAKRNRGFLIINITGLAIGLAVSIVLMLFVATELSYDRHFENRERIVQLNTIWNEDGKREVMPINLRVAYTDLPAKIPGIEAAVQIYRGGRNEIIRDNERFQNVTVQYTDPEFFEVFRMDFLGGNPATALQGTNTTVMTDALAMRIFGTTDALGRSITFGDKTLTVTGVVKELPENTHFTFDMLVSIQSFDFFKSFGGLEFFTYYLISEGASVDDVCKAVNSEYKAILSEAFKEFNAGFESATIGLTDIYLHSISNFGLGELGSTETVLLLAGLALLILLLAITNFINLFVIQGDARAMEVGIRKATGGSRRDVALQFFGEAAAIVLVAFIIGAGIADAILEPFASIIDKSVEPSLAFSPPFIAGMILLLLVTIILSASYPAIYLSRFNPVEALRKARRSTRRRFTTAIAIFQAVITIVLLAVVLLVNRQINYLQTLPKGYDPDNVLAFRATPALATHYETLRQEMKALSQVQATAASQHMVGGGCSGQGISLVGEEDPTARSINEYRVLPGLCEIMKFELVDGSFFSEESPFLRESVIINEAAARMLGISGSATGKKVVMFENPLEIIGVVRDFYYDTPSKVVEPLVLTGYATYPAVIYIRFNPALAKSDAIASILPVLKEIDPNFTLNPVWCDEIYSRKFNNERSMSEIVKASTVLSLIIALLGLIAIHSYSAARRTKEIGVRKVFGETTISVMMRLSLDVVKWIAVAGVVAIPVAMYISSSWLSNYANRTPVGILVIAAPVLLQGLFSILATILVTARASAQNPADALRYE
jgi:putative ABC transport system permease protein